MSRIFVEIEPSAGIVLCCAAAQLLFKDDIVVQYDTLYVLIATRWVCPVYSLDLDR